MLLERWHADATALVVDVSAMFASAVPGTPRLPSRHRQKRRR